MATSTTILDKLKFLSETLIQIDKKLGFSKIVKYVILILIVMGIFNFSTIVEHIMKIQSQIEKREHEKRLVLRDNLMAELSPMLVELRSSVGASRLLYFEYHNSTENFVGIPFKFANLVITNQEYECPGYNPNKYKDINSGLITNLYADLRKKKVIINKGEGDIDFRTKYPNIHDFFFTTDGSTQQMFINIPGVSSPIGMIVIEWVDDRNITSNEEWGKIQNEVLHDLPRINGIISKYTP